MRCPECGHDRQTEFNPYAWVYRLLRRPKPVCCPAPSEDAATVWGGEVCGCDNPAHQRKAA